MKSYLILEVAVGVRQEGILRAGTSLCAVTAELKVAVLLLLLLFSIVVIPLWVSPEERDISLRVFFFFPSYILNAQPSPAPGDGDPLLSPPTH